MSENTTQYTGTGTESDPITFNAMRTTAPDPAAVAVASQRDAVSRYEASFRSSADLSANLPADLRQLVSEAASTITTTLGTVDNARVKADGFRADKTMYPEGRDLLASEALKDASDKVSESLANADARILVAESCLYEAARPTLAQADAMTARADLQMMTARHVGNPAALSAALRGLAQSGDAVGALVADPTYLGRYLDAQGVDADLRDAILTQVRAEVVKAAAASGDPKRSAAGKTASALTELRRARVAATAYTRHKLAGR